MCWGVLTLGLVLISSVAISSDTNFRSVELVKSSNQQQSPPKFYSAEIKPKWLVSKVSCKDNTIINILRRNPMSPDMNNAITNQKLKSEVLGKAAYKVLGIAHGVNILLPNHAPLIESPNSSQSLFKFLFLNNENQPQKKYFSINSAEYIDNNIIKNPMSNIKRTTINRASKITVPSHAVQRKAIVIESTFTPAQTTTSQIIPETSAVNDKVKFFEKYDINTLKPLTKKMTTYDDYHSSDLDYSTKDGKGRQLKQCDASLEYFDKSNKSKHIEKKHIQVNLENSTDIKEVNWGKNLISIARSNYETDLKYTKTNTDSILKFGEKVVQKAGIGNHISRRAFWYSYPFAGAYIYEPANIHCDAAAISPHWFVAAGSCLSMNKITTTEGQSAFVAYCGLNWRQPGRRNYVKYTTVHPKYQPHDNERKFLFNIGLIRVVTSMSTCPGWAPVSVISHQFSPSEEGLEATAVGWGLDRYKSSRLSLDHFQLPLMVYESLVYFDKCPGSFTYSKAQLSKEDAKKNLYCLNLPPYLGEKKDPVHGSLLLYKGNLIALYLQEERHPEGPQSAQYTGVWRGLPWVTEVAQELDEFDELLIDNI